MRDMNKIDYSEETQQKHENGCPICGAGMDNPHHSGHRWMSGVPTGTHYAVYDCGTWAFPPDRIGFADAVAFAVENGMDVYLNHDTCGKRDDGIVWAFRDCYPDAPAGHRPPEADNNQAKVTLALAVERQRPHQVDEILIHWSERPTPPPRPYNGPRGPRKR